MSYKKAELEIIYFEDRDILTESTETPIQPLEEGEEDGEF